MEVTKGRRGQGEGEAWLGRAVALLWGWEEEGLAQGGTRGHQGHLHGQGEPCPQTKS